VRAARARRPHAPDRPAYTRSPPSPARAPGARDRPRSRRPRSPSPVPRIDAPLHGRLRRLRPTSSSAARVSGRARRTGSRGVLTECTEAAAWAARAGVPHAPPDGADALLGDGRRRLPVQRRSTTASPRAGAGARDPRGGELPQLAPARARRLQRAGVGRPRGARGARRHLAPHDGGGRRRRRLPAAPGGGRRATRRSRSRPSAPTRRWRGSPSCSPGPSAAIWRSGRRPARAPSTRATSGPPTPPCSTGTRARRRSTGWSGR
jgi:hypothetical protein